MANGRIPGDILYGELVTGTRTVGRPYLRYKDASKRDLKMARIDITNWATAVNDRGNLEISCQTWHEVGDDRIRAKLAALRRSLHSRLRLSATGAVEIV